MSIFVADITDIFSRPRKIGFAVNQCRNVAKLFQEEEKARTY